MESRKLFTEARDIVLLVIIGFAMTWLGLSCPNCRDDTRQLMIMGSFTAVLWIMLWKGNEYLGNFISSKISWVLYPLKRFAIGSLATVLYTVAVMYFLTVIYEGSFSVEFGDGVFISVVVTIAISLFMHAREFLMNWRKVSILAEQYERESVQARYETLKNQVNPHFLFNSLNALTNLIYEDEERALIFIDQLSQVYQYVINTQHKETVCLEEEKHFLESYLYLQQIRFGDKLRVNFSVDGVSGNIPPLALQMLIENAIKHNVISEDDPLTIAVYAEDSQIVVENNLQKRTSMGEDSSGLGLENIRKRYEMLSDKKIDVQETGNRFRVKIPLL
jgi:sensor histidine kinase YesM